MDNNIPSSDNSDVKHQRLLPEHIAQPKAEPEEQQDPLRLEGSAEYDYWQDYERILRRVEELEQEQEEQSRAEEYRRREEEARVLDTEARRWRNLHFQEEQERVAAERQRRLEAEMEERVAARARRARLRLTSNTLWITLVVLTIACSTLLFSFIFPDNTFLIDTFTINDLRRISIAVLLITGSLFIVLLSSRENDASDNQLSNIRQERRNLTQKIEKETKKDIFYRVQLNLNQLTEYYTINKNQARNSFNFSIGAASIGLATIIAGIWLHYLNVINLPIAYITCIVGALLEFTGGAYFFIYKKSIEQVNLFFNQLVVNQDTMLAIELTKLNRDSRKRAVTQDKIIAALLERSQKQ